MTLLIRHNGLQLSFIQAYSHSRAEALLFLVQCNFSKRWNLKIWAEDIMKPCQMICAIICVRW